MADNTIHVDLETKGVTALVNSIELLARELNELKRNQREKDELLARVLGQLSHNVSSASAILASWDFDGLPRVKT